MAYDQHSEGQIHRHFLGWDSTPLELAADWIAREVGPDQADVVIALPGARAGRLLRERLAVRFGPAWTPAQFVNAGTLTDVLLEQDGTGAGRLARTLAWVKALQGLQPGDMERVAAEPPQDEDLIGWTKLAADVRTVFGELAAEGLGFGDVAEGPARNSKGAGERARWAALARAQTGMQKLLAREGLVDPHLARLEALEDGRTIRGKRVVLVGVVELNQMTRGLIRQTGADCLVFAPDSISDHFDDCGCVEHEKWGERHTSLPLDSWSVVEQPVQQAELAIQRLAAFGVERYRAEEVTIGVARPSVTPYLQRQLAASQVDARDAAGTPLSATAPVKLLSGLAEHLASPTFQTFAALLRHPELARALAREDGSLEEAALPQAADAYQEEHVPHRLEGSWPLTKDDRRDAARRRELRAAHKALGSLLGTLHQAEQLRLDEWVTPIRRTLELVYDQGLLGLEQSEEQRRRVDALSSIGAFLGDFEQALPQALSPRTTAAEALQILLENLRSGVLPPPATRPGQATIELLGWMELPLDDAPALVVTGFDEGCVPEALGGDGWLPESARRELGLPGSAQRLARDHYFVELLVHSRESVAFVSGRKTLEGDPVLPSRIAFLRPPEEIPTRIRRALPEQDRAGGNAPSAAGNAPLPFVPGLSTEPSRWSATAFAEYLASPYLFWVQRILGRRTADDSQRELDALRFGNLAHAVLQKFGEGELANSTDPEAITELLQDTLHTEARERFGTGTYPAVQIQLHQLQYRLEAFAAVQARRASEGWKIAHVEWSPEGQALDIPGGEPAPLVGFIDRIDRHPDGRWAILDYKTGEKGDTPEKDHLKAGAWVKLQLPLYAYLARELTGDAPIDLGYITLGGQRSDIGIALAKWDQAKLDEALDEARRIVAEVRTRLASGEPFEHGRGKVYDPILKALVGERLVGAGGAQ